MRAEAFLLFHSQYGEAGFFCHGDEFCRFVCYFNSMNLAMDNGIRSIAFPSISTGVYSFPVELAAKIAVHTVNRFLQDNPDSFDLVEWVLFDAHTEAVYEAEVDKIYE